MELSATELQRLRHAAHTIQAIVDRHTEPRPVDLTGETGNQIAAWVGAHLVHDPASRTPIGAARDQCRRDTGIHLSSRQLGAYVAAPRYKSNGVLYLDETRLTDLKNL